jgi:DnaJ-class molecular chaperone
MENITCPTCNGTGDFTATYYPYPVSMCGSCYGFGLITQKMAEEYADEPIPVNVTPKGSSVLDGRY